MRGNDIRASSLDRGLVASGPGLAGGKPLPDALDQAPLLSRRFAAKGFAGTTIIGIETEAGLTPVLDLVGLGLQDPTRTRNRSRTS